MGKREYIIFLALVFELVGLVVGLVYAGYQFDRHYGYRGVGITAGAVLAIVIWVFHLVKAFKDPTNDSRGDKN